MDNKNSLEIDAATKKFFTSVLDGCRQVFNSYDESQLQEPWLTHYRKIKSDYDSALRDLGPVDQAPAALEAHRHLGAMYSLLSGMNAMCSYQANHIAEMKKKTEEAKHALNSAVDAAVAERIKNGDLIAKADVDNRVTAEIARRTTAGDLIPKDTHTQLCSAAKELGIKEGRTAAEQVAATEKAQRETVEKRRASLVTNGLPIPAKEIDKILGGTDEEFGARQTEAKNRMEALTKRGISLNAQDPFWSNVWLDKEAYTNFETLVNQFAGGEPFAGSSAGKEPTGVPVMLV